MEYMRKLSVIILLAVCLSACSGSGGSLNAINLGVSGPPETPFTIHDPSELIGGPLATGRVGDVLLANDRIKVIIEQPGKNPWVGNFGGSIIDADLVRSGAGGQDNFGFMHPLINIEWTVNVFDYEVIADGSDGGAKVFRSYGVIDIYDYLDIDFISPVANAMMGQMLYFAPRFDDVSNPFNLTELKNLNTRVVTDYTLEPGKNYVRIDTHFQNLGGEEIFFPVGEFVNGSGELMFLIPGLGFTPELEQQITNTTPGLVYAGFVDNDVSYGYFFDVGQFVDGDGMPLKTTSLSYSGVTGIVLGEDFLKVLPLGSKAEPKISFSIPPGESRIITRYFIVGNGSGGSVFDTALNVLDISTNSVSGTVVGSTGNPIPGATVAMKNEEGNTVITYKTDSEGRFSGLLSTGEGPFDQLFGKGRYSISVYKKGYGMVDSNLSGECNPGEIDVSSSSIAGIECRLGVSGVIKLVGGVIDEGTGQNVPARFAVIGMMPSYKTETGGEFEDEIIFERPLGIVDIYYVNAQGTIGVEGVSSIRLPPGEYELVFMRGVEYSMVRMPVSISSETQVAIGPIALRKVVKTPGYISADFHLHSIYSPDSAMQPIRRALAAAGEGMDVLQSSDHDYLVDYAPYVERLENEGMINPGSIIATIVGDEISPNHIGHMNFFPLEHHPDRPCGGAIDWGYKPTDVMGPVTDYNMSPQDLIDYGRSLPGGPILQINHISDLATSILILGGWVTTPFYYESFGVEPLSSYGDPVGTRMEPKASAANYPYPYGSSEFVVTDFDAIELCIGPELYNNLLLTSGLPQWFNLLNLGIIATATSDSDSHREIANTLGTPRNFVRYPVDPADGVGSKGQFDVDDYVAAIRGHKVVVSAGPFVQVTAVNEAGDLAEVGDAIRGSLIEFRIKVDSPEWAWFDTIEVFANTEPIPADDENGAPLEGAAKDPAEFFAPYHVTRYYYEPTEVFSLSEGTLTEWKNEEGLISASVDFSMEFSKDTWVVVFVRGTKDTEGYTSLFPFVTRALVDADNPMELPEDVIAGNINMLALTGAPAWGFTNPIFVDVDGGGFQALYSNQWSFGAGGAEAVTAKGANTKAVNIKAAGHDKKSTPPKSAIRANSDLLR